jgi:hemolysin III
VSQSLLSAAEGALSPQKPKLRGVLHALVAGVAVPAGTLLALHARSGVPTTLAIAYAAALVLVFGTSGLYHMPLWPLAARRRLRRLDHSMIYLLIAGSYAPFAYHLDRLPRAIVLSITIGGALIGFVKAHAWEKAPRLLTTGFYVLIGWCIAPFLPQLSARIGGSWVCLLLAGGAFYTSGALVYWLRRPNPWPRTFGYHEVNHLLGLPGAVLHYIAIWHLLT